MSKKKKKICMIVQDKLVKGGIAAVVNGYRGSDLENKFEILYVESYCDGGKITKLIKAIKGYAQFIKVLLVDKPDLVHVHSSFGPSFYRKMPFIYISSLFKKKIINHIHGAEFEKFYINSSILKKKLIRQVYKKCSVLIALSEEWKKNLNMIVPESCITIIENYSLIHEDAIQDKQNRGLNYQVLFLGEIGKRKGCYDIPKVIQKVVLAIPNVKFVIAGSGDVNQINALAQKYKIKDNIIFPGWIRDKEKDYFLRESDIFFLPSYNEGMPMSILDAMGYGLPIISSNVGGIPKIVQNKINGYTYEPGDIDGFASGIISLLQSKKRLQSYSNNSIKIVESRYTLESHLITLEKLYESLG